MLTVTRPKTEAEPVSLSYNPVEHALTLVLQMTREQRLDHVVAVTRQMSSEDRRECLSQIAEEASAVEPGVVRQIRH